jgi:hypothetical protein
MEGQATLRVRLYTAEEQAFSCPSLVTSLAHLANGSSNAWTLRLLFKANGADLLSLVSDHRVCGSQLDHSLTIPSAKEQARGQRSCACFACWEHTCVQHHKRHNLTDARRSKWEERISLSLGFQLDCLLQNNGDSRGFWAIDRSERAALSNQANAICQPHLSGLWK